MAKENLAEMPENYDMMDEVKASAVMNETEEQKIVASNVNDNQEGENPPSPKGGAATKAVEENTVNENARDISQPLTVEDIVKSKQLSPEMLAEIINAAKNDNLFPVDNLDGKELTDKINELHEWVNAEESRLKSIPFSIELYNQKKAVLQARAAYVLILECLIGEKLREIPRQNGTNENSESRASGETRTKSQIIKEEYGLSPRLARDFQHLTWDGVKAAIGLAFKQKDSLDNISDADCIYTPFEQSFGYLNEKFDIIITNPPYKNLKANENTYHNKDEFIKDKYTYKAISDYVKKYFHYANEGVLNLYKIFVEDIICNYSKENAIILLLFFFIYSSIEVNAIRSNLSYSFFVASVLFLRV